ncbi:cation diffusion facilitator family transporter [Aestuariibacter sp. GS-14]|uniref:cation diffusion facilitator family transporter n=1 Tax=Aestuariibacter sp. GS-14 TaxID=2590670 RepID=UPI002107B416|nr:cation diffusion facilitator family transporter [Aestuariibacter sp. GS-14]
MNKTERFSAIKRVLIIEGCVNLLMTLTKLSVGIITHSSVILADALHSLTDLFNNVIAFVAIRISQKPPDHSHPYGHQKFEYLAIFLLAVLLSVVSLELVIYAIEHHGNPVEQNITGLVLLILAIAVNFLLSRWQMGKAKFLRSELLAADAKHTLSDVLTSVAVLVGWQLAASGWYWLDTVFCLGVALLVAHLAWELFNQALPVLVDANANDKSLSVETLSRYTSDFNDIARVAEVRSRRMGEHINADLTLIVSPHLTVTQAHKLAHEFEDYLKKHIELNDVVIHIEPDELSDRS